MVLHLVLIDVTNGHKAPRISTYNNHPSINTFLQKKSNKNYTRGVFTKPEWIQHRLFDPEHFINNCLSVKYNPVDINPGGNILSGSVFAIPIDRMPAGF